MVTIVELAVDEAVPFVTDDRLTTTVSFPSLSESWIAVIEIEPLDEPLAIMIELVETA